MLPLGHVIHTHDIISTIMQIEHSFTVPLKNLNTTCLASLKAFAIQGPRLWNSLMTSGQPVQPNVSTKVLASKYI